MAAFLEQNDKFVNWTRLYDEITLYISLMMKIKADICKYQSLCSQEVTQKYNNTVPMKQDIRCTN